MLLPMAIGTGITSRRTTSFKNSNNLELHTNSNFPLVIREIIWLRHNNQKINDKNTINNRILKLLK
jgi:hypothetical protein